jgi:hypothetical protein
LRAHLRAQILGGGQIRLGTAGLLLVTLAALTSCSTDDEPASAADGRSEATTDSTADAQADARSGDSAGDASGAPGDPTDGTASEAPADSPYAGLNPADVRDLLDRDQGDHADEAAKVAAIQEAALGWYACRGVYEVYDEWARTGKLGPKPTLPEVKVAKSALKSNRQWLDSLYAPLADDDRKLARQQLESDYNCGLVPVAEQGDRSLSIGDALSQG